MGNSGSRAGSYEAVRCRGRGWNVEPACRSPEHAPFPPVDVKVTWTDAATDPGGSHVKGEEERDMT